MKKLVAIVSIIFTLFVSYVFIGGFLEKQSLESNATTTPRTSAPSSTSTTGSGTTASSKTYTASEVSAHNSSKDCWLIINGSVYDVTDYIYSHPGGAREITIYCGVDATTAFDTQGRGSGSRGHSSSANAMLADYLVGSLQ